MELLLSALQQLPEYRALVARLEAGSVAALSGVRSGFPLCLSGQASPPK